MKISSLLNEHTYLGITVSALVILLFDLLGVIGLGIYGILIIYSCVFFIINIKRKPIIISVASISSIAFYLYFILALFINGSYSHYFSAILQFFLLTIIAFSIRQNDELLLDVYLIAKIYTAASIFVSISSVAISIITIFYPDFLNILPESIKIKFTEVAGSFPARMGGLTGNANTTAILCAMGFILSIFLISVKNISKKWKIITLINIILSFYMIFLATCSRTSMLTCLVFAFAYFIIYFLVINKNDKIKKKFFVETVAFCFLMFCLFLISLFLFPDFRNYIFNHVIRVDSLSTGSERLPLYEKALALVKDHIVFGYNYQDLGAAHAHNLLLQIVSFGGIPSLVLFGIYFFSTLVSGIKNLATPNASEYDIHLLSCFCLAFIFCFMSYGITEGGAITSMRAISICTPVFFAFANLLTYNKTI